MRLRGKMSTRSSSHTEINWTRLWVVITHVTLDFGKGIHTLSARRRLIMEKLSGRRRSRLVSACGTRLVNNRLSETCAHHCLSGENLRDAQTVGPTQTSRRITLRLIGTTGKPAQSCWTQALFFFSFYNCPHSVHHQQGGAGNWTRKGHLVEELLAINTVNLRGITVGQDGVLTSEMLHKTGSQAILSEAAHYCVIESARSLAVWCWMVSIERSKVRVEAGIVQF